MFYLGLDLGKRQDYTAIAVVERREQWPGYPHARLHSMAVRHVERMPLGTPYVAVVERVKKILGSAALRGDRSLTVDGTGVGAPVVEMLKGARLGCEVCEVIITAGESATLSNGSWKVPKQDLMDGLRVLLEGGRLRIARDLKHCRTLMRELMDVQSQEQRSGEFDTPVWPTSIL